MKCSAHDAERAVLGAILLEGSVLAAVAGIVGPADFDSPWHQGIFSTALKLASDGAPVDAISIPAKLHDSGLMRGHTEQELAELANEVPSTVDANYYATMVAENAQTRRLRRRALELVDACEFGSPEARELALKELKAFDSSHPSIGDRWVGRILERFQTAADAINFPETNWIVRPWIAAGSITSLDGLPKGGGKTTLLLAAIRKVIDGGTFLGEPTTQAPVVFLTEESPATFRVALDRAGLLDCTDLHILYRQDLFDAPWSKVIDAVRAKCESVGAQLVVIDTFAPLAGLHGDDENSAGAVMDALDPVRRLVGHGYAAVLTRHERKKQGAPGSSGRGSNALTGGVDTILTIRRTKEGPANHRVISALSRFDVPAQTTVARVDREYEIVDGSGSRAVALLDHIPENETDAASQGELAEATGLSGSAVQRHLAVLIDSGCVLVRGAGKRNDPKRYWRDSSHPPHNPKGREET